MRIAVPLCAVIFAGLSTAAFADSRGDVLARLSHCDAVADGRAWLDCYYAAAQPQRSELGLPPAPQAPAFESLFVRPISPGQVALAPRAPAAPPARSENDDDSPSFFSVFGAPYKVPPDQFGLVNAKAGPGLNVDRIVEKLSSYTFAAGNFTVTLANGQVWRQTGGPRANWRSTPANYTATVTHGALRTFNLRVQDGRNADDTVYKVERVH